MVLATGQVFQQWLVRTPGLYIVAKTNHIPVSSALRYNLILWLSFSLGDKDQGVCVIQ
jgi:hypothetical protein